MRLMQGAKAEAPSARAVWSPRRRGRDTTHRRYRTSDGQSLIGYTSIIIGSISLGGVLLGYLRGSEIVPMFVVASVGLVVATLWCAAERKFQAATVFGVLAGFNLSYALLQLGVTNNWYAIPIQDLPNVLTFYSIIWIVILLLLSFVAYNAAVGAFALFLSVGCALGLVALANAQGSLTLLHWASVPLLLGALISAGFIAQVMWGWHRRNSIELARQHSESGRGGDASDARGRFSLPRNRSTRFPAE